MTRLTKDLLVFAALLGLLAATVALDHVPMSPTLRELAPLAIAVAKAALVIVFFMRARSFRPIAWILFASGVVWWAIHFGLVSVDARTREAPVVVR